MSSKVRLLPAHIIAQISAGEVVESPISALKELIENSIDAKANEIDIIIEKEGFKTIQIRDNGTGIDKQDLPLVLQSFTTSKLSSIDDLYKLSSLGFRGEALGAISSVANISVESRVKHDGVLDTSAWKITSEAGVLNSVEKSPLVEGTRIIVSDLFYNAPVRKEFQKNAVAIKKGLYDLILDFSLCYPNIAFRYVLDNEVILRLKIAQVLSKRINDLFVSGSSIDYVSNMQPVYYTENNITVEGYISNFSFYKTNASLIRFFINQRIVQYKPLVGLFKKAYGELMPPGRFPIAFLFVSIDPSEVDVNVHPQKKEVKFRDEGRLYAFLLKAMLNAIEKKPLHIKNLGAPYKSISKENDHKGSSLPSMLDILDGLYDVHTTDTISTSNVSELAIHSPIVLPTNSTNNINLAEHSVENPKFIFPSVLHSKLYDTFILASSNEGIFLIDQHTLHERINYEDFLCKLRAKENMTQILISPKITTFSPSERLLLQDKKNEIEDVGFIIEDLGPAGFVITGAPFYLKVGEEEEALKIVLEHFEKHTHTFNSMDIFKHMAASLSCREAIKKGDTTSLATIQELLERLKKCENPARCPHGRPTFIFLGKDDIFKLFKR